MHFSARLETEAADPAMLLFQFRRAGATAEIQKAPNGAKDLQVVGELDDADNLPRLLELLAESTGAIHIEGRHFAIGKQGVTECGSIEDAEAHMDGPLTVLGTDRALWSFGDSDMDRIVQTLFFADEPLALPELRETTGLPVERAMKSLKKLEATQTVRRYRPRNPDGTAGKEAFGVARDVREKISAGIPPATAG